MQLFSSNSGVCDVWQEQPPVEEKPAEEKKEEPPLPPLVLFVDLHCVGCAKKVERTIMKIRGVEGVLIDMTQNQVTVKGVIEPQAISEAQPIPGLTTLELIVDMHCQACAEQLSKKILKIRGIQSAVTEHSTGKVTVTGTIDANKLIDYVYRRTKKQARIVPQPEPEKQEEKKEGEEKPSEEPKPEEKPEKKEEPLAEEEEATTEEEKNEDECMKKMIYYYQHLYVVERMPPAPQLFSDENPNACCIS
ncbi:hypothetical protein GQ457_15G011670 [Hibiscus cannabinus]